MLEFFKNIFSSETFMPHGHCYLWRPEILWLHVVSDGIIGLAYASIPFALVYLVRKRKDLAFNWVFIMFGIFILACGATHFISIWTVWDPIYRFDGIVKAVTALASIATAVALWPLLPKVLVLPSPAQLEEANKGLHLEIVERKRAEAALEERNAALVEAEKLKSEFIANVSHELRTPLSLVLAPVESLLIEGDRGSAEQRQTLVTVHNNTIRLLEMVNSLLDFSKLEANKLEVNREPIDAVELTRAILADFSPTIEAKDLTANLIAPDAAMPVLLDRYLYERILFNLLGNAVKFTEPGGQITVTLNRASNGKLRLVVCDSGVGISVEDQKHLFQKFRQLEGASTRRFEGTGLGLALVKQFSELLGGGVWVESELGSGSVFTVDIAASAIAPQAAAIEKEEKAFTNKYLMPELGEEELAGLESAGGESPAIDSLPKVLLAEDNEELANYIQRTLRGIASIRIASDGEQALAAVHEWAPDLVVSDVMMPKRDGFSFCRAVKENPDTRQIPIVMLTAQTHREALLRGWEAGADEYLFKPFHPTELMTRIKAMLRAGEALREAANQKLEAVREQGRREEAEAHVARLTAIETELRRLNRVKDEFLATVSHELRTPMNAIIGWAELLYRNEVDAEEYREAFDALYRNARAQAKIIDDVLDVSRVVAGKLRVDVQPVKLGPVIEEAVSAIQLAANAKRIEIDQDIDEHIALVAGDPDRLKQVVWNLLLNAVKFSPKDARVLLQLKVVPPWAEITVRDQGEGIDQSFLPYVFERFLQEDQSHTRRHGGLGLGLSIVRHIVELHGGKVKVESAGKGKGASFTVNLPLMAVRPIASSDESGDRALAHMQGAGLKSMSKTLVGVHVLIVDDDPDARRLVGRILAMCGAMVEEVESADKAFEVMINRQPDVLISDISMPGEDGYGLIRKVREQTELRCLQAAALTAHAGIEDRKRAITAGFNEHLPKPIDPRKLVDTIVQLTEKSCKLGC